MKTQESLMTIIALVIGLCITLALIFFNFSLAFTLKLLRTGSVPFGRYIFMISICAVNTGVVIWLGYILKKAQTAKPEVILEHPKLRGQTPIRGPYAPPAETEASLASDYVEQDYPARPEVRGVYAPQNDPPAASFGERQEKSTQLIIALAQSQNYLSLEDVMGLTGLNDTEGKYLLSELVKDKTLKKEDKYNRLLYSLNKPA